ncbi:hypothetical protein ABB37_01745 [Leptomonas pyrrhocoris]|uniref:Uncharacterized protein n=1 Tax=Leptomonas pyrrhocoris TaxID=157538 RepID=A0A0M9G9J8_LEPPY|nr:hypothetical protein ABB37_01745 [Leptomonas pyrrhocoris]KPA85446.1 hypothetical protein ABB37_01745 [Leptomonas pyrrhocoris]|eukprot:XP_015663885.1 hypothetical protein ABB37_01745 [Leptomonas pyrrhocoris]
MKFNPHSRMKARKRISFNSNRNKVRFIHVPPRSQNKKFWFTETQRVVKKGLNFEVEPEIMIEVNIECRMQITAMARKPPSHAAKAAATAGLAKGSSLVMTSSSQRSFVEVQETNSLFCCDARGQDRWQCIGSVGASEMKKVLVTMPPGTYRMRCVGGGSVQLFAQAWDIERELI